MPQASGVTFEKSEQAIIVNSKDYLADAMVIVPAWDETTSSCQMYVNEDRYEIWQLSQKALGTFFFG